MYTRTLLPAAALLLGAASLTSCDEVGLPVTQAIDGGSFTYTIPAGELEARKYDFAETFEAVDVAQELKDLGIDVADVEKVEIKAADIAIANGADVAATAQAFVSLQDLSSVAIRLNEEAADGKTLTHEILRSVFAGKSIEEAATTAALDVVEGVNLAEVLTAQQLEAAAEITFAEAKTLEAPVTITVDLEYDVIAKVGVGTDGQ